ncbi:MAG: hypothetical protein LBK41_07710 [Clostridiales bacterium]|jgi:chitinase|nr:hypothetical protein [Clostridiales bacterium]
MPLPRKVLAGYWFRWAPFLDPANVPDAYDVVIVAFMEPDETGMPRLSPYGLTDPELRETVALWKARGKTALVSIGGATGHVWVTETRRGELLAEMNRVVDAYGFDGADIDLEGASIHNAGNSRVIPSVLRDLREARDGFVVTLAPEFSSLRGENAAYGEILRELGDSYDMVWPQLYNQGEDGIWALAPGLFLQQNSDEQKEDFIYTVMRSIIRGDNGYIRIPPDKLAVGLPASPIAALDGYAADPSAVINALGRLEREGTPIRGLMTWSINQDSANGFAFAESYAE